MCCHTCQSKLVLPPFPLQRELSPKQNTILRSSFPFPLPSDSCLPSTCPLCSPVLLLPPDTQTRSQHNSCPQRWHSPVALPISQDRASSCLLSHRCGSQAGWFSLARWLQAQGVCGSFSEQEVLVGQIMIFILLLLWKAEPGRHCVALCPDCRHRTGSAGTCTGHWVDEILKSHSGRFWYLALAGTGLC